MLPIVSSVLAVIFCISTVVLLLLILHSPEQPDTVNYTSKSTEGRFKKAAVVSENSLCSEAGRDILLAGGNAVEAAISTLLCIGVVHPHLSGLGGGFLMTIYNRYSSLPLNLYECLQYYEELYGGGCQRNGPSSSIR